MFENRLRPAKGCRTSILFEGAFQTVFQLKCKSMQRLKESLTALEAHLVPFQAPGNSFLRGVHGFAALGTLGVLYWFERHSVCSERCETILQLLSRATLNRAIETFQSISV